VDDQLCRVTLLVRALLALMSALLQCMCESREEVQAKDGTTLLVDWAERPDTSPNAPVLILFSGVTGSGCALPCASLCVVMVWH
jgi:predicted alpha/beta-fold hydrolase